MGKVTKPTSTTSPFKGDFKKRSLCLLSIAVLLTGCLGSSEPTATEVSDTLKAQYIKQGSRWAELISAEKIACVTAKDKPGFSCDVKVTESRADPRIFDTTKTVQKPHIYSIRFVKTETGWEAIYQ
ncbi:MAG: hypothetical protein NTY60_01790 [Proteobacteria bacterium]|nr:hypothetical protein [Pseudomonadota bacterium]